ncbi:MAG: glycogen/starch synthase [Paludibacteraceae bacterium]|nr:glycogen/starch synthase [Paludibacteraceae bacterium]
MKESNRILFVSQQIYPYLPDETPIRLLNRHLPEFFQSKGFETRTFMPKFGEINERRNQLHEVIRLSGMNIIIQDTDHPLIIKVASIPQARIQVYFIDNDDYFMHRKGIGDEKGEYADNDERSIFFACGVMETIKKLRWTPDIVHCSGWMSALVPLYLKTVYKDTPFFGNARVVVSLDDQEYQTPFGTKFAEKIRVEGMLSNDVRSIEGFPVGYEDLMRLSLDNADAIVLASENINQRLVNYAETSGKPILSFQQNTPEEYMKLYNQLLNK